MHCITYLAPYELPKYVDHLLRLNAEDRRLRFGFAIDDAGIRAHVAHLDVRGNRILAQVDDDGRVVGAAHIALIDQRTAEFAFSVDLAWRGRGLGGRLFDRAVLWARNRGVRIAHVYCLADNHIMRQIARKAEAEIHTEAGESEGCFTVPPATPFSFAQELAAERWGMIERQRRPRAAPSRPPVLRPAV